MHPVSGVAQCIRRLPLFERLLTARAGFIYNQNRKPVVFDPVGVGATQYRRTSAALLLNAWQPTVIKGNAAELGALANSTEVRTRIG